MRKTVFICIIVLAAFLRIFRLGEVPISPDWDEAALGYNAYSVLRTGRDEYGVWMPRTLRSFDDYKPPLYMYLAIPTVAAFGLNTFAVRLPSAIMGTLAVAGVYFLVLELLQASGKRAGARVPWRPETWALLTMALLAVSPWHLQFSRIAFEANTGITLNIWGLVAFFRGFRSARWMSGAAVLFGLALYAYHSERVFVPLILLACVVLWRRDIMAARRNVLIGIMTGVIVVAPLVPVIFDKTSMTRLRGTSTLSDTTGLLMRSVGKMEADIAAGDRIGAVFENRRIVYIRTLLDGYLSHFSMRWLFLTGDNDRHHAPDNGLLYLWELPFLLGGLVAVWKLKDRMSSFLLLWLAMAPIAASPTSETPHAIRSLVALPAVQMVVAAGILATHDMWKSFTGDRRRSIRNIVRVGSAVFVLCAVGNIVYYFHMYYVHMNLEYSRFWQYGYKQAVEYAEEHKAEYDKIVVSTELEQPHMFFLFYTKYDPVAYLAAGGTSSGGFEEVRNRFDTYEFRRINWQEETKNGRTLYIGSPKELPGSIFTISYLSGEDAIRISR